MFDHINNTQVTRTTPSAHTFGHVDCPACDRARTLVIAKIVPSLTFAEASEMWLHSRKPVPGSVGRYIEENTEKSYQANIDSLNLFFANLRLEQIHLGHIRQYQEARLTGAPPFIRKRRPNKNCPVGPCPAGAKKVNQEIRVLRKILCRAGCWNEETQEYHETLIEEVSDIPRSLEPQEQKRWLEVALLRQDWWIVYWYSVLAFETSMSTDEERALRIGDINLYHGIVNVREGKNIHRSRTIPVVSAEAKWSCEQLLARAKDLGATGPLDYIFPFRMKRQPYDPTKPMTVSGIKKQWNEVRAASGLTWFRQYDTRHTAVTRWAESGMDISQIMAMTGHMGRKMMMHYTHISMQSKRMAMEKALGRIGPRSEVQAPFYVSRSKM